MSNEMRPRYAGVGEALPAALMVWKVGQRLVEKAEQHPAARTWARVGLGGAAIVALAALAVGLLTSMESRLPPAVPSDDDRLDDELAESFPASDAPAVTRAG